MSRTPARPRQRKRPAAKAGPPLAPVAKAAPPQAPAPARTVEPLDEIVFRPAKASEAPAIARILNESFRTFGWMPILHTLGDDLAFIFREVLPTRKVTVAERAGHILGFIAVKDMWVTQLYLSPAWTGRGIGRELLSVATAKMPLVKLHCFQANAGARRFYERHRFRAEAFGDGSGNEEGLPDILYVRRS